ncbi:uncharacterized protein [Eucyclogobius newberryi]|uniref:uncharacterized protein n=1 Tax=Eucyclogobius newberryi TaxID=166745 RepID=UPI003B58D78E
MNGPGLQRTLPEQFSGSGYTFSTTRHQSVTNPILSKRVCFYKSGDPQFNGLQMVINNRTFKTFDALLDSLSKKVPLPFGVRNITTPRGVHAVSSLDELEDGKSYICSDHRKVKPINLAVARRKPTPWYHAQPESSGRRAVQQRRLYTGYKLHNSESVLMHTPKKLLVFRNGHPAAKYVVVLQKKTTPTFESILRYISELMQFDVAKLHTPEGRRVDGLPGLIMCSGTVVAAGREKFISANYVSQKTVGPTRMRINRRGVRRLKALNHKKRSYALKSRIFSPSSERYIVSQIHNTIAESLYSRPTNSNGMESSHVLESVAESEVANVAGAAVEGQDCLLPAEDDIEKSFRVNQDGSMTVEMKVRLTIKEEETVHWMTTLSRSCASNQFTEDSFLATEQEGEISQPESDHMDLQPPTATTKDKNKDICHEDPTSMSIGVYNQGSFAENNTKGHKDLESPLRTPSPGEKQFQTKQSSVESITSLSAEGVKEDSAASYFRQHLENGDLTDQYCKQTNSRPIPKPRRVGSGEINSHNISTYESADMTESFQMDSSGEEVTETVMHIYEQQICQDNFLANICVAGMSKSAVNICGPATPDTGHHTTNSVSQPEQYRPSTAAEPVSLCSSESISFKSNLTSQNTSPTYTQPLSQKLIKSKVKDVQKERRVPPKHKVTIKRLKSPGKKVKDGKNKKNKPFTSARFISQIYGNKSKSKKDMTEHKKKKNTMEAGTAKGSHQAEEYQTEPRETFTGQTSLNPNILRMNSALPLAVMSNSGTNEYVEDWLEKSHSELPLYLEGENESHIKSEKVNLENDPCLMSVAEKVKCLKEKPITSHSSTAPLPNLTRNGSVRQKVKSFENKSEENHHTDNATNNSLLIESKDLQTNIAHKSGSITVQFEESSNWLLTDLTPPPAERLSSLHAMDASAASSPLYRLSSVSDIHPLSSSPTADRAISPTDRTIEMESSIQTDNPLELREAPLQRAPSIKRDPLVSNLSLERKMSLKKACLDEYTIPKHSVPLHIHTVTDNSLEQSTKPLSERLISKSISDLKSQSNCSSASPVSPTSVHRTQSVSSSAASKTISQSNEKELVSPKPFKNKVKHQTSEVNKSPRLPSMNHHSPNVERKKAPAPSASPASEKRQILNSKSKLLKKSPYSQSLDLASPPVKHKSPKKSLHRNISADSAVGATNKTSRKTSSQKRTQLSQSSKSNPEEATTDDITSVDHERNTKVKPQPLNMTQTALEHLCFSISAIHQMTQHKQSSCLPDFSSHVSSTFGSSSKVLLAFLSVIALKETTPQLDAEGFDANGVSCAEALGMIDSLREIARLDEPQTLQMSLSHLRQSASPSLLQSWRRFQEFCEKTKSHNSPKTGVRKQTRTKAEQVEDNIFDELMVDLGMPGILRSELASFPLNTENTSEKEVAHNNTYGAIDVLQNLQGIQCQSAVSENQGSRTEEMVDSDCYVELNVGKPKSEVSFYSESETSASDASRMQLVYSSGVEVHSAVDDTATDIDETSFSEEDLQNTSKELNVIVEEPLSDEQETGAALQKQPDVGVDVDLENDSGNEHSSCEDDSTNNELFSLDGELRSDDNEMRSEEETGVISGCIRDSCDQALLSEDENIENIAKRLCDDMIIQSVSEHAASPEKKVANGLRRGSGFTSPSQTEVALDSDGEESSTESPMSPLSPSTRLAPQSSLSFSYDSSNVITKQPEGNRVKSIREMFLAKSASENQSKTSQNPQNTSDTTELRAETSVGGGYRSQSSGELSSGEDDSARKSIAKGFVMRTIERLYGKKESATPQVNSERPLSANKQKKKDQTSLFSPFHATRSKTESELSYFNSSNALDALKEARRCIAFNAQVGDSVHLDNGRCFLEESPILRKSVSDPVAINQSLTNSTQERQQPCKDVEEKTPYLLFKTDSEDEQKSRKCTYFSLPHDCDSEAVQEESVVNIDIKGDICCESKDSLEDTKMQPEKNGKLLGGVTDFKLMDNKVHPLVEEIVVVQPIRGQGVIDRRLQEPDVLDNLYHFCGEHCPIL